MKIGIALAISCVISLVFGALSGKFAASASAGFAKNLRKDMFYNVQNFSFSNIDKFSASSIVTRLTTDITNVQSLSDDSQNCGKRSDNDYILAYYGVWYKS